MEGRILDVMFEARAQRSNFEFESIHHPIKPTYLERKRILIYLLFVDFSPAYEGPYLRGHLNPPTM